MAAIEENPGLLAHDVMCGSCWQDGVNNGQHGKEFDALCARLVQDQLTHCGLALTAVHSTTGRGLVANRGLLEAEINRFRFVLQLRAAVGDVLGTARP